MNGTEIATRVKRQFGDEAGAQIIDSDIIRWINDAQREIAVTNSLLQATASTPVVAGTDQYQLPTDMLILHAVRLGGRKLEGLNPQEAKAFLSGMDATTGEPTHYTIWALRIDLFPTPVGSSRLQIYYSRQPLPIVALDSVPELPLQYHNRIVEYCIAQAHELDDDMPAYKDKMSMFQNGVERLKSLDMPAQDTYPSISTSIDDVGGW